MWRRNAARWAALIVGVIVVAACVGWAVLAQTLTTPACDLPTPPSNVGYLECPTDDSTR
jgi:hypothetical protein